MTKKERTMLENYLGSDATYLHEVYGRFSREKERAYENCKQDMIERNGKFPRIPTSNSFQFTYAFQYQDDDGKERLRYHTPSAVHDFEIGEL